MMSGLSLSRPIGVVMLLGLLLIARPAAAEATVSIAVRPGDTWTALALRYATTTDDLHRLNGVINPARQPAIGGTVRVPDRPPLSGRPQRPSGRTPVLDAVRAGRRAFAPPGAWLAPAGAPAPDLPPGVTTLKIRAAPVTRGHAVALRGSVTATTVVSITLEGAAGIALPFDIFNREARFVALRGLGAFHPIGPSELSLALPEWGTWSQPLLIADGVWQFDRLTLTGEAATITAEEIAAERARLAAIWSVAGPEPLWQGAFRRPLDTFVAQTSTYGARRSVNGGPFDRYHEGIDFAAYAGTPVVAGAGGIVVVAETLRVRGGAVIIDHGLGVYSGYYHLSEVAVAPGEVVASGALVGRVGSTGYSTGNHLHWDFLVSDTWVDADAWIAAGMGCWLRSGLGLPCG